jgi:DNA-binding NtrC family response regulator
VLPAPIRVPSLVTRTDEIPRIVDEYARDAVAELRERERRRYKRRSKRRHRVAFTA